MKRSMNKAPKKSKPIGGPFLAAAIFCENIMQEADGPLSAIRIVDKIDVAIPFDAPPDLPSEENRIQVQTSTLLMLKSGGSPGKHVVSLVIQSPSGKKKEGLKQELTFNEAPSGGANMRIQLAISIMEGGLFLVDVVLDGRVLTRMPLQITLIRQPKPAESHEATKPAKPRPKGKARSSR